MYPIRDPGSPAGRRSLANQRERSERGCHSIQAVRSGRGRWVLAPRATRRLRIERLGFRCGRQEDRSARCRGDPQLAKREVAPRKARPHPRTNSPRARLDRGRPKGKQARNPGIHVDAEGNRQPARRAQKRQRASRGRGEGRRESRSLPEPGGKPVTSSRSSLRRSHRDTQRPLSDVRRRALPVPVHSGRPVGLCARSPRR